MEPKRNTSGEAFLHSKQPSLYVGPVVEHEQARRERAGEETHAKPVDKIADWMEVLEKTHGHEDSRILERIKQSYRNTYVIKPESIPESAFLLEQRIARQLGHGDMPLTQEYREAKTAEIISNQEASLDKWVDYLTSEDAIYPTWAKYWAFDAITKMGRFEKKLEKQEDGSEKEVARFATRELAGDNQTTAQFPPLNPRALALTIGVMQERIKLKGAPKVKAEGEKRAKAPQVPNASTKLSPEEFQALLSGESFSTLYTQFLIELPEYSAEGLQETRGAWRVFPKGSDPQPLVDSLEGYPLEWCTANVETARTQLQGGDFHVYYSLDQNGEPTIPRVAIRMQGDSIAEVRGIAPNQNSDPYIGDVIAAKMSEFPDGEHYQKKSADMARVTEIEERLRQEGQELSRDDLRFLYEIDGKIEGFGYQSDPRVESLIEARDHRSDLATVFNCRPDQIGIEEMDVINANEPLIFYYGSLSLDDLISAEGLVLPQAVGGDLGLSGLFTADGLVLPSSIRGSLYLDNLTSAAGLVFPPSLDGELVLTSLTTAENLVLPETFTGTLNLSGLTTAEGLILPKSIDGTLYLNGLANADGLVLPSSIRGSLYLDNLTSAAGLVIPPGLDGALSLYSLTTAEGLVLPETFTGTLNLSGLTTAEGLILPKSIDGTLYLDRLATAEGLVLPESITGSLNLNRLTTAKGLILPKSIDGTLFLKSLTTTEGLILPQHIGRGLALSEYQGGGAGGYARVSGLTIDQIKEVISLRPDLKDKIKGLPPWALNQSPY